MPRPDGSRQDHHLRVRNRFVGIHTRIRWARVKAPGAWWPAPFPLPAAVRAVVAAHAAQLDGDLHLVRGADHLHLVDVEQGVLLQIVLRVDVGHDGPARGAGLVARGLAGGLCLERLDEALEVEPLVEVDLPGGDRPGGEKTSASGEPQQAVLKHPLLRSERYSNKIRPERGGLFVYCNGLRSDSKGPRAYAGIGQRTYSFGPAAA